jgi:hypothetical protein
MFRCHIERVVRAAGGTWHGSSGHIPAPGHSKRDRGISITLASDRPHGILVNGFNCDPREAYRYVIGLLGIDNAQAGLDRDAIEERRREHRHHQACKAEQTADKVARILAETAPIEGTPAEGYFQSRAIRPPYPRSLRFHRGLITKSVDGTWIASPAIVAIVTCGDTDKVTGLHRIFLTKHGRKRSDLDAPKKMLGKIRGGAVWPDNVATALAIAEGVETALSFQKLSGYPTAAALAAGFIRNVVVPEHIVDLIIAADNDVTCVGLKAAKEAARNLWRPWRTVRVLMPNSFGDFNDLLAGSAMDNAARLSMLGVAEVERIDRETPPLPDEYFLKDGKIFFRVEKEGKPPAYVFVCSQIVFFAQTRDDLGDNWGRFIRIYRADGSRRSVAIPMSAVENGSFRTLLMNLGVVLGPSNTAKLALVNLFGRAVPNRFALCTSKIGWRGGTRFVLPEDVIGLGASEQVVYQQEDLPAHKFLGRGHLLRRCST